MYNSKAIVDAQQGVHKHLAWVVDKHLRHPYRKPYRAHNLAAVDTLQQAISQRSPRRLILDSCCGTGLSSVSLAQQNPDALVVAVDQSAVRLAKQYPHIQRPDNLLMLRANCEDFWRLCVTAGIRFDRHYILYPNPWPKAEHLKRRWHGHPIFPSLAPLATTTILRSNWDVYLQEFAKAWAQLTGKQFTLTPLTIDEPLTLFERKYAASGQALYQLSVES